MSKQYQDENWLREKYIQEEHTTDEMAEMAGCTKPTILRYMENYDIERRDKNYYRRKKPPKIETKRAGHERVRARHRGTRYTVSIHQLVALSHGIATPQEVFGESGCVIHHKNEIPWDNRPCNLTLVSREEHIRIHDPHPQGVGEGPA